MKKLICAVITLTVLLALICTASAETIQAKAATIDINHLEGRMVKTDIDYKEGNIVTLTLYENERFDADAIKAAKAGDRIVTDGEEVVIESIDSNNPFAVTLKLGLLRDFALELQAIDRQAKSVTVGCEAW